MSNPLELKPQPPEELSVRAKVHADWKAISKKLERNHNLKIEILQISLRLAAAEAMVREGRADPTYDWTADIASARFLHEQMLVWSENNAQYHLFSANYWRDLSKRQWDVAYDYTLSGINALLLFNGGVALGCLGGLVSERGNDYKIALGFGIWASFFGLLLCAITIACTTEWLSEISRKTSGKLINPPTSLVLKTVRRYAARYHRKRGVWIGRLHYISLVYFFMYILIGIMLFFDV